MASTFPNGLLPRIVPEQIMCQTVNLSTHVEKPDFEGGIAVMKAG